MQLSLELSRRTDPQTSKQAAERVPQFRARHEAAIYAAICESCNSVEWGATAKEIASVTGLTDVQVNRRLCSMGRRGLIRRLRDRDNESRCKQRDGCAVWYACK